MIKTKWPDFKAFVDARELSIQYLDLNESYYLVAPDDHFQLECVLDKNPSDTTYLDDFETNYKANGNKPQSVKLEAFNSKKLCSGKSLFKRETGIQASLSSGSNDIIYTISYNWVKFIGIEIFGGEHLDYCDLYILDAHENPYFGAPDAVLNQFGFSTNICAGEYEENSTYDADLYLNMQIKIVYNSVSAKTVAINFNLNEVK